MKFDFRLVSVSCLGVLAGLGLSNALSQQRGLDPTVVSPDIYTTVLENDSVRVIKVTARNGSTPQMHSHPDRVVVNLNDCTWLSLSEEGSLEEENYSAGAVSWELSVTHGGQENRVRETCELLEIEIK